MSFWSWLRGSTDGETANGNPSSSVGPPGYTPGDPDGVTYDPPSPLMNRSFPTLQPSPWSGWPSEWSTPSFTGKGAALIDTAWDCLDLNSSILSTMPTYRKRNGEVLPPAAWMQNPDAMVYESWAEFARSVFWHYQMGEAFILCMARDSTGYPAVFREIPPFMVDVELRGADERVYRLGGRSGAVLPPEDVLHIRYRSHPYMARGEGPLDVAGARIVAAGLMVRLVQTVAEQGGVPPYFLSTDKQLTREQGSALLDEWVDSRTRNNGRPALLAQGVKADSIMASVSDMALLELGQWTEGRICNKLGVPPVLMGYPGGDSMTYANISQLFDFHDRRALRPFAKTVMAALSNWALPRGQCIELDSDEYTRPGMLERSMAYANWAKVPGAVSGQDVRQLECLEAEADKNETADTSDQTMALPPGVTPITPTTTVPQASRQGGTGA